MGDRTPAPDAARPVRVVVVDDEAHARDKLRRYLDEVPGCTLAGEASDGRMAVRVIEAVRPDVVLLDIHMPELDGFDVLDAVAVEPLPHVVFVTASDTHAVRAFEVHALDYLLKPVDRGRFADAMARARAALETAGAAGADPSGARTTIDRAAADASPGREPLRRFLVRSRGRMELVPVTAVDWIGAAGNYVEVHTGADTHLVRGTMARLETRLPEEHFARIHRSTIVNLNRVAALHPWSHGDLEVELVDGTRLRLSRRYRGDLDARFGP